LYQYSVTPGAATQINDQEQNQSMEKTLSAFVQRATLSLLDNSTGAGQ
jgi:hypothetical protein